MSMSSKNKLITYVFIDASNLFYGGEKSLGWKIDYQKLYEYLRKKFGATKIYYFGGVETYQYGHDYLKEDNVDVEAKELLKAFIKK